MASLSWIGGAPAVKQKITVTVGGTVEAGDKFKTTIGNVTVSVSATTTSTATTASEVCAALAALDEAAYPQFTGELTFTYDSGSTFTIEANTAGVPFTVTLTTTESNDGAADNQTFTQSTTTANSGPHDASLAANYSTGALPVNTNDLYIENTAVSMLYGLDALSGVTLASLTINASFTDGAAIGLPKTNALGYPEYREQFLRVGATVVTIGRGEGKGSGRIKLNVGSVQAAVTVYKTATPDEDGIEAFLFKGTHASNTLTALGGTVGVAIYGGETSTIDTLRIVNGANVRTGAGVTLTTVKHSGSGTAQLLSAATNVDKDPSSTGKMTIMGAGNYTAINLFGGELSFQGTGTVGTLNGGAGATLNCEENTAPRTFTNANYYAGFTLNDRSKSITHTNPFATPGCSIGDVHLNFGHSRTYQVAA